MRYALAAASCAATVAGLALILPAVWWSPLNVDEEVTRAIAPRSFGSIWHIVWGERGGGPLHFFVEHATLAVPGGLVGLRAPSILFFLLAIPATVLIGRELAGDAAAIGSALLLAAAPLAVAFATFGRPHVMLMAWFAWALWLALRAARTGGRGAWLAGGLALAASVFVHPIAPVYAAGGLAAAVVYGWKPVRALVHEAGVGVAAFAIVLVPYYVHTLRVLRDRYDVGSGRRGRTYSGDSVFHDAITALGTSPHVVNLFTLAALAGIVALAARGRWRAAAVPVVVVAAPILFFSFVPSGGRSALFFTRYMLPALPVFLPLVAVGCVAVAGRLPRGRGVVAALLVAVLVGLELRTNVDRLDLVHDLRLGAVVDAVEAEHEGAVLFGATGTIGPSGYTGQLSYGRPPVLMDQYLSLRIDGLDVVDDSSCVPAVRFLHRGGGARRGLWLFYGARPEEADAGAAALGRGRRIAQRFVLVESEPLGPRALLHLGARLRRTWARAVPRDFKVGYLIDADETALRRPASCEPLGEFGDPDITPARRVPGS